jgi:DNA-3-methyladenine glycosylase I
MSWYCDSAAGHPIHGPYHEFEYGFPLTDEAALFERLSLEIFQAGLSWLLVLKKRPALKAAFDEFDVDKVAAYGDAEIARLLADSGIIRNRLKIVAIIENGTRTRALRDSHGGFAAWLASHHPQVPDDWVATFRRTFRFTGTEVVREFLMSVGYLPGAHHANCPVYTHIARQDPPWLQIGTRFYDKT